MPHMPHNILQLLKPGDFFAFDTLSSTEGDVLYAEVLEVQRDFDGTLDRVGGGSGGYKVLVHCAMDLEQGTLEGVEDFYAWDAVDGACIRLSPEQMARAREAVWPAETAFLRALLVIP